MIFRSHRPAVASVRSESDGDPIPPLNRSDTTSYAALTRKRDVFDPVLSMSYDASDIQSNTSTSGKVQGVKQVRDITLIKQLQVYPSDTEIRPRRMFASCSVGYVSSSYDGVKSVAKSPSYGDARVQVGQASP